MDKVLLDGVLRVLAASKVIIDDNCESGQVVFNITRTSPDSQLNEASFEWSQYVVDDLFGGVLSLNATRIILPLVLSGIGA